MLYYYMYYNFKHPATEARIVFFKESKKTLFFDNPENSNQDLYCSCGYLYPLAYFYSRVIFLMRHWTVHLLFIIKNINSNSLGI